MASVPKKLADPWSKFCQVTIKVFLSQSPPLGWTVYLRYIGENRPDQIPVERLPQ